MQVRGVGGGEEGQRQEMGMGVGSDPGNRETGELEQGMAGMGGWGPGRRMWGGHDGTTPTISLN